MGEYFAGIDIGSTMTKVVIINGSPVVSVAVPTSPEQRKLAYRIMEEALSQVNISFEYPGRVLLSMSRRAANSLALRHA